MKLLFRLLLLAAVAALGYWLWTVFFPDAETVIRKRLNKVAALVSFTRGEGNFAAIASVERLSGYLAPDIEISVNDPYQSNQTLSGRSEVKQSVMAVRKALAGLKVEFVDLNVSFNTDRSEATVLLTGRARLPDQRDLLLQELKVILRKIDGEWLITRVETVRTLT
jgi:hypothetical protein